MTDKVLCQDCGWRGVEIEMLRAPNPFDAIDEVIGCPSCKAIDSLIEACDAIGCWRGVTCGTPTPHGYRNTCGEHMPKDEAE